MDVNKEVIDIKVDALLLGQRILRLEKEEYIYMWDEVISYLEGEREEANK